MLINVVNAIVSQPSIESVLLVQRRCSQKWEFPGGHLESGETLMEAARRELEEETSLLASHLHFVCVNDYFQGTGKQFIGATFSCILPRQQEASLCDPDEHSALGWFTHAEVEAMAKSKDLSSPSHIAFICYTKGIPYATKTKTYLDGLLQR